MASSLRSTLHIPHLFEWAGAAGHRAATAVHGLGGWIARRLHGIQQERMIQILSTMTDAQLENVGITRAEIPAHVAKLMASRDTDG